MVSIWSKGGQVMKHTDTRVLTVEVRPEKRRPRWCDDNSIQLHYVNEKAADGVA
jgi:hypothetical protein